MNIQFNAKQIGGQWHFKILFILLGMHNRSYEKMYIQIKINEINMLKEKLLHEITTQQMKFHLQRQGKKGLIEYHIDMMEGIEGTTQQQALLLQLTDEEVVKIK